MVNGMSEEEEGIGKKVKKGINELFDYKSFISLAVIGFIIGYLSGGVRCGLATALYGWMFYLFGAMLSLLPVGGVFIDWYWLMPTLQGFIYGSTGIRVPALMLLYNIYLIIPIVFVNAIITLGIIAVILREII